MATRTATTVLRDGEMVTVDGPGELFAQDGVSHASHGDRRRHRVRRARRSPGAPPAVPAPETTGTLLYVNLAIADHAEEVAALPVDGVGLLRAEFMITDALAGEHPKHLLATGRRAEFLDRMSASVLRITQAFAPVPWSTVRSTSAPTSSAGCPEGEEFEPVEANPMIGYRGCYRYIRDPGLFALDLDVIARSVSRPQPAPDDPVRADPLGFEACLEAIDAHPGAGSGGCTGG